MLPAFDAPRRMPAEIDLTLLWSGVVLLMIGMVMVYSASIAIADAGRASGNQPMFFLVRHGVFLAIGLVSAGVVFQVPLATWQQISPWLFVAGFVLLALVLIPAVKVPFRAPLSTSWFSLDRFLLPRTLSSKYC